MKFSRLALTAGLISVLDKIISVSDICLFVFLLYFADSRAGGKVKFS